MTAYNKSIYQHISLTLLLVDVTQWSTFMTTIPFSPCDFVPSAIWVSDRTGDVMWVNQYLQNFTGLTVEKLNNRQWDEIIHPEDREKVVTLWRNIVDNNAKWEGEYRVLDAQGKYRWFRGNVNPVDKQGQRYWVGSLTFIDDLKEALSKSEKAKATRDDFMSIASHELKTPLTALILQVKLLGKLPPEKIVNSNLVSETLKSVSKLDRLIDDLLDVHRIDRNALSLKLGVVNLKEIIFDIIKKTSYPLNFSIAGSEICFGDSLRLTQVFTNILNNAMKFGANKPINIDLRKEGDSMVVEITDGGIGIDPKYLHTIFDKYERGGKTVGYGGLGIGLYVANKFISAHGGTIVAESDKGKGSKFIVTIPTHYADSGGDIKL